MAVNKLTRGKAAVGALTADITASAGSIGSTELASDAVTTAKVAAGAVTDPKVTRSVATPGSSVAIAGFGTKILTAPGSSAGKVYTIGTPSQGDHYRLWATGTIGGSTAPICVKSTGAAFTGSSTQVVIKFQLTDKYADIHASSTTRWLVATDGTTGVVFSNAT